MGEVNQTLDSQPGDSEFIGSMVHRSGDSNEIVLLDSISLRDVLLNQSLGIGPRGSN